MKCLTTLVLFALLCGVAARADEPTFLNFIQTQAAGLQAPLSVPQSMAEWREQRARIRQQLENAWGGFPVEPSPLNARIVGTLQRDGYRVEKVVFQTMPDVWMTANAYVPEPAAEEVDTRRPAVLCVHGHWRGAKQDPHVQARCIGLVKLGFFVLAVDAFGAGERGVGKALGEYHGEMVSATLWPVGRPLSGLQVYENRRAVDYLLTRSEVDEQRIGITGASGGGNQTMYAGAFDERLRAVVPVCSVGNYQAYLGAACCMCEVVPGALQFTEEWGVLSLTAPRALMVISATRDAFQFSVGEAKKSLAVVESVYRLHDTPDYVQHAVFESPHDYNQPMREAMYGWMTRHLKGQGDGKPIAEPDIKTEEPDLLRCYPGDSRPDEWITIPRFAAREGRRLLEAISKPSSPKQWQATRQKMAMNLDEVVLGGTRPHQPVSDQPQTNQQGTSPQRTIQVDCEPGLQLTATHRIGKAPLRNATVVVLSLHGEVKLEPDSLAMAVHEDGYDLVTLPLRATGRLAHSRDKIGRAPDHNTAEWSLWLGRPLLGQWVLDVRATLDALQREGVRTGPVTLIGIGPAGLVATTTAAVDSRVQQTVSIGSLASFLSDVPIEQQRLGILPNGIVRNVGDIQHLAALIAPRRLIIAGGVLGSGHPLAAENLAYQFEFARHVYRLQDADSHLSIVTAMDPAEILTELTRVESSTGARNQR